MPTHTSLAAAVKSLARRWTVVCLPLFLALPVGAQNLVSNGEFDLDVDGWTVLSPSISDLDWNDFDATECGALSGSALATNFSIVASGSSYFYHCVPGIAAGETYSFGGLLRFVTGQAQTGYAKLLLRWMEQNDCLGNIIAVEDSDVTVLSDTAGTWVASSSDASVAPAGTQAAAVGIFLVKDSHTGALDLRFDSIYLVGEPGFLFADDFEHDSSCRWSSEVP